jgi:hypothetical protein
MVPSGRLTVPSSAWLTPLPALGVTSASPGTVEPVDVVSYP